MHLNEVGGQNPGNKWFVLENSPTEVHALTRLEGDLGSTLMFEHRGGQSAIPLWVAHILLGCLFRE